jgi:hypothetical protein
MEKRRKRKAKESHQKLKTRQSKLLQQSRRFTKLRQLKLKTRRKQELVPPKNSRQQTRQRQFHLLSPPHRVFQKNRPKSAACHQEKSRLLKTFLRNVSIQLSSSFDKVNFFQIKLY